ncbi:hypothetical protein X758_31855 [Mesorhizobium sp. LSHC416B00]|nr:hypothetical protein X761_32120 [Mesorhizobium sp. LSHC424B00]ESX64371.1 hypothetical protein X758_31855 [Mesorhizobium sp. LSHC416B00]
MGLVAWRRQASFAEPNPATSNKDPDTGVQQNFRFALNKGRPK